MLLLVVLRHAKPHEEFFAGAIAAARENLPASVMRLMVRPERDTLPSCVGVPATGECPAVRRRLGFWHRPNYF